MSGERNHQRGNVGNSSISPLAATIVLPFNSTIRIFSEITTIQQT